jgi:site-specific DNA recombinase
MTQSNPLRFAPLIRVSTEGQAKKGESLAVQKERITQWVSQLGGVIPKACWRYTAQEHATPDAERAILDHLLEDAAERKFDCVIVTDTTRWARDNLKSEQGLRGVKTAGIKFYVGTTEHDIDNPLQKFMLTMGVGIGELYAMVMVEKSLQSKIKRAREGKAAVGSLPYGRTFDKESGMWGVDAEKRAMIRRAAEDFLQGTPMSTLEKETGLSINQLYKLFRGKAGSIWEVNFKPKSFPKMAQKIVVTVPPLLLPDLMEALRKRLARGRAFFTANHHRGNNFLLRGCIFCGHCGYALSGAAIGPDAHRYYMHAKTSGKFRVACNHFSYLKAGPIEDAVMGELFALFGDKKRREEALLEANGGLEEAEKTRATIGQLESQLSKVLQSQERLIRLAGDGKIPDAKIKPQMDALIGREAEIKERITELQAKIQSTPSLEDIKKVAETFSLPSRQGNKHRPSPSREAMEGEIQHSYLGSQKHLLEMSFEEKCELLRMIFGTVEKVPGAAKRRNELTPKFVKGGVYVERMERGWRYTLKGILSSFSGYLPTSDQIKSQLPSS